MQELQIQTTIHIRNSLPYNYAGASVFNILYCLHITFVKETIFQINIAQKLLKRRICLETLSAFMSERWI